MARVGGGMYGLSGSGMDVDDMVKKMMTAQQASYDKMFKSKTKVQWQKTQFNTFYKSLTKFRSDTLSNYKMPVNMLAKSVKIADDKIFSAVASSDAVEMKHDVEVKKLAQNAYLQSKDKITRVDKDGNALPDSSSTYLRDIMGAKMPVEPTAPPVPKEPIKPTEPDPVTGTPDEWTQYQADLLDYTNVKMPAYVADKNDYDNNLKPAYDANMVTYNGELDKVAISYRINDGSDPSADDKVLTYTYRDLLDHTLNDFASDINKLGSNIQASYDNVNDSFSLTNKVGGDANKIAIGIYMGGIDAADGQEIPGMTDPDQVQCAQRLFNNLHLAEYDAENGVLLNEKQMETNGFVTVSGKQAEVVIDGRLYKSNENRVVTQGITYTLNKVGSSSITVNGDSEKVIENVKKFVEDYNKMIDSLNGSIYETVYKDFEPLTDEERSAMSEEEIKKWEEKAKSGVLANDSILKEIVSDMRAALSQPIEGLGEYNSMAKLGITTTSYKEHGHIELNEDVLRKALKEEPDAVYKVFTTKGADADGTGVIERLSGAVKEGMDKISLKAGLTSEGDESVLGTQLTSWTSKMRNFQTKMDEYQAKLYKQFNAMEVAIASLNQQASFVASYTSGQ